MIEHYGIQFVSDKRQQLETPKSASIAEITSPYNCSSDKVFSELPRGYYFFAQKLK